MIQNILLGLAGPHYFTYNLPATHTARFAGFILTVTQLAVIGLAVVAMLALHFVLTRGIGQAFTSAEDRNFYNHPGIDPSGIVVTNNHVIADADEVTIILNDGTRLKAEILGRDTKVDLALLRVKPEKPLEAVHVVKGFVDH